jgi:hypothetical protein
LTRTPTIACRANPSSSGVGHGDDLHHAGVDQPLHALPDGRLGETYHFADRGIRTTAVGLELFDDRLRHVVQRCPRLLLRHGPYADRHSTTGPAP